MKSKRNRKSKTANPKVTESKPIRKTRSLSRKKPISKPKDLLNIDDREMNELLTEFAKEENKINVIKIDDKENELDSLVEEFAAVGTDSSEDEFDSLLEEFATADSDPEEEQKESTTKVILSPSDDEIDDLLDDFNNEDLK